MAEVTLAEHLAEERSVAIRTLLAAPLVDVKADPTGFRLVARHQAWLVEWFESSCGWRLVVDAAAGFARLAKRAADPDPSRPLRRSRGAEQPFDRRRYQLLCLACAELVRHPVTTVGLLARALAPDAGLDTSRHAERAAFVDALRALAGWGALTVSGGEVESFLDSESGNALLMAETSRVHRLLATPVAPSALPDGLDPMSATSLLLARAAVRRGGRGPRGGRRRAKAALGPPHRGPAAARRPGHVP